MKKVTSLLMAAVLAVTSLLSINMIAYTSEEDSMPFLGNDYYYAGEIKTGDTKLVAPFDNYRYFVYRFEPEVDVNADFFSYCDGNPDTYGELYDSDGNLIESNDDSTGLDFTISYHFEAGEVYFLAARPYSGQNEFYVTLKADTFDHFTYTRIAPISFYENTNGYAIYDDNGIEYFDYNYDSEPLTGDVLTIYYNDGTPAEEYVYNRRDCGFFNEDGDSITNYSLYSNQYEQHWTVDSDDNHLIFEYRGIKQNVPVNIKKNTIANIELLRESTITLMENLNSSTSWDENGDKYQHYNYNLVIPGDVLRVTNNDGTYVDYEYAGGRTFYNSDEGTIDINESSNCDDQYKNHWGVGTHEYTISVLSFTITAEVEIIPDKTTGISFEFKNDFSIDVSDFSNLDVYVDYDENGEPYIATKENIHDWALYEHFDQNVVSLTVYFNDGTSKVYKYYKQESEEMADTGYFMAEDGEVIFNYEISKDFHFDDKQLVIQLELLNYEYTAYGTVTGNDVDSISFEPVNPWSFVENTSGFEHRDAYIYNEYGINLGDKLTINYKDGTSRVFTYSKINEYEVDGEIHADLDFKDENGERIDNYYIIDTQYDYYWEPDGKLNYVVIIYGNKSCLIPVEIIGETISEISYIPAASIELIEGVGGIEISDENDDIYFNYTDFNFPMNGDVLNITDKNGDVESYTYHDGHFFAESGNIIDFDESGNARDCLTIKDKQYNQHWTLGSNNFLYLSYMGKETSIQVQIKENTVTKIQYIPTEYDRYNLMFNTNGQWQTDSSDDEYFDYTYPGIYSGDKLKVWYTDSSVVTYVASYEDNNPIPIFTSEADGSVLKGDVITNSNQGLNHWYPDTFNKITIEYSGRQDYVQVKIAKADLDFTRFDEIMNEARDRVYMICYAQDDNFFALDDLTSATHDSFSTQAEVDNYVDEIRAAINNLTLIDTYTDSADGITWTWKDGVIYLECDELPTYPSEYAPWRDFKEFTHDIYVPCNLGWNGVGFDGFILENGVTFAHDFVYDSTNSDGELMYECSRCDSHQNLDINDVMASWDVSCLNRHYGAYDDTMKALDVVHDGIINAKDYAKLNHIKNFGY